MPLRDINIIDVNVTISHTCIAKLSITILAYDRITGTWLELCLTQRTMLVQVYERKYDVPIIWLTRPVWYDIWARNSLCISLIIINNCQVIYNISEPYLGNHEADKEIPHLSFPQFLYWDANKLSLLYNMRNGHIKKGENNAKIMIINRTQKTYRVYMTGSNKV